MNDCTDKPTAVPSDAELAAALRALPTLAPSDALQARLRALPGHRTQRRRALPAAAPAALMAASAVIAALLIWRPGSDVIDTSPAVGAVQQADADSPVAALQAESAYLDNLWSRLPVEGRVQRVGTASTITALEDRVAIIDAQLSQPQVQADSAGSALLWRQRVGLMNTLVALRGQPGEPIWL